MSALGQKETSRRLTFVVLETTFDEAWFTLKSNGITTVKPDELARCVLQLAMEGERRSMTSYPRPLGARRTDIDPKTT